MKIKLIIIVFLFVSGEVFGNDRWDELIPAIVENDVALVKDLIKGGVDVDRKKMFTNRKYGQSPLMFAVDNNRPAMIELLIDAGAKIDNEWELINQALGRGCKECFTHIAKKRGLNQQYLIQYLSMSVAYGYDDYIDITSMLLEKGVDPRKIWECSSIGEQCNALKTAYSSMRSEAGIHPMEKIRGKEKFELLIQYVKTKEVISEDEIYLKYIKPYEWDLSDCDSC